MSSSLRRLLTCACHWDFEGSLVANDSADPDNRCRSFAVHLAGIISRRLLADSMRCTAGQAITIDDLPDDVLLAVFDFYVDESNGLGFIDFIGKRKIESWQSLVHVCRRWRCLVFASPRRLNLRLWCTPVTSARSLNVWPALPLIIHTDRILDHVIMDNVIAELEHSDRIGQIRILLRPYPRSPTREIETLWTAMQVPFPELIALELGLYWPSYLPVLPDSFLGGSAPRLRYLFLRSIPFPGIPKLLLSATHLVQLRLRSIPHSGYISPEAMVTCLSALTSLEWLQLGFQSPESCPDLETQPPFLPTRFVLPSLTAFGFKGACEYLEEFLARIDTPQVHKLDIVFFNDIDFDTPELTQFISRTPILGVYNEARLIFDGHDAVVSLLPPPKPTNHRRLKVTVLCQVSDWQLSFLAQMCTLSMRLLLTMENLYIYKEQSHTRLRWKDDIEETEWLDLLHPFSAVKSLYLCKQFAPRIAPALQELIGERTTEVLPALQNILLEGFQASEPVHEGIARFISARQLINQPVVISVWHRPGLLEGSEDVEVGD